MHKKCLKEKSNRQFKKDHVYKPLKSLQKSIIFIPQDLIGWFLQQVLTGFDESTMNHLKKPERKWKLRTLKIILLKNLLHTKLNDLCQQNT